MQADAVKAGPWTSSRRALDALSVLTAAAACVTLLQAVLPLLPDGAGAVQALAPALHWLTLALRLGTAVAVFGFSREPGDEGRALASTAAVLLVIDVAFGPLRRLVYALAWFDTFQNGSLAVAVTSLVATALSVGGYGCLVAAVNLVDRNAAHPSERWRVGAVVALLVATAASSVLRHLPTSPARITALWSFDAPALVWLALNVALFVYFRGVLGAWSPEGPPGARVPLEPSLRRGLAGLACSAAALGAGNNSLAAILIGSGLALAGVALVASGLRARGPWIVAMIGALLVLVAVALPLVLTSLLLVAGKIGG